MSKASAEVNAMSKASEVNAMSSEVNARSVNAMSKASEIKRLMSELAAEVETYALMDDDDQQELVTFYEDVIDDLRCVDTGIKRCFQVPDLAPTKKRAGDFLRRSLAEHDFESSSVPIEEQREFPVSQLKTPPHTKKRVAY